MSRAAQLLRLAVSRFTSTATASGAACAPTEAKACGAWASSSVPYFQRSTRGFASGSEPRRTSSSNAASAGVGEGTPKGPEESDEWGNAIIEGDWDKAWEIFETTFPVDGPDMPGVLDIMALDSEAEEKAARRQRELDLQEEALRSHVRVVDGLGRAQATGKRKTSIARVWIWEGQGHMMVNKQPYDQYFKTFPRRNDLITPFAVTNTLGTFDVMVNVAGGGTTGQAQAVRHGIAKALQLFDPEHRPGLKTAGLLTRDARIVERKKPGRKKARKAFQWVKR